jgi:hypothetical protein
VTASAHDAIIRLRQHLESYDGREAVHIVEPGQTLIVNASTVYRESRG